MKHLLGILLALLVLCVLLFVVTPAVTKQHMYKTWEEAPIEYIEFLVEHPECSVIYTNAGSSKTHILTLPRNHQNLVRRLTEMTQ